MEKERLEHFRKLLLEQRQQAMRDMEGDRAVSLNHDDGVKDSGDMSELDLEQSTALTLGERQWQLVEDIDEALARIDEGTYGQCLRCGKSIDEERLEALPTAKYDAACKAKLEAAQGLNAKPTI